MRARASTSGNQHKDEDESEGEDEDSHLDEVVARGMKARVAIGIICVAGPHMMHPPPSQLPTRVPGGKGPSPVG